MIYLDNASTSFPKPKEVADKLYQYMTENGCNISRGGYQSAYNAEEIVFETRTLLQKLFEAPDEKNVIFTKNATEGINFILKGFLKPGDHILISSMEHNCVMRPLSQLNEFGITYSLIPCDTDGTIKLDAIAELINPNTKALLCTHASNVCGTILPLKEIGEICKESNIRFFVDTAQTAGIIPISMKEMHIDALAFTGHKGLYGPQGIGGFIVTDELAKELTPLLSGGSGSFSHTTDIPPVMPDRFEAGTLNLPGIYGLHASLTWLNQIGLDAIYTHEMILTKQFIAGLQSLESKGFLSIVGKKDTQERVGVVSIQINHMDNSEAAYILDDTYQIMTRVGLHCAPIAHQTLGTYPTGTLRFSFGYFNTQKDVNDALFALEKICYGI